jgi:hypothetical protein
MAAPSAGTATAATATVRRCRAESSRRDGADRAAAISERCTLRLAMRGVAMANARAWLRQHTRLPNVLPEAVGLAWALVMVWVLFVGARDQHTVFTSHRECGTDPQELLGPRDLLEQSTLRFIIDAHCANARYVSDERIELRYGGTPVEIELRRLEIGGATYYAIDSVGGAAAP